MTAPPDECARVPQLFHVSDAGPLRSMIPRPSPAGTVHEGRRLVWAVDATHLPNYLLPRECPRVCWLVTASIGVLASVAPRVVAVEKRWLPRLRDATLYVHELEHNGFVCVDATAGYWVAQSEVQVRRVRRIDNCVDALARHPVELRPTASLEPYVSAVIAEQGEFSVIRIRNAQKP